MATISSNKQKVNFLIMFTSRLQIIDLHVKLTGHGKLNFPGGQGYGQIVGVESS
jgi:hypothetical protein